MTDTLDIALELLRAGISIIPIRLDMPKHPSLPAWKEFSKRLPEESEVRAWFRPRQWAFPDGGRMESRPGIAAVGGVVSGGLECLDFDEPKLFERWADDVDLADPFLISKLVIINTPADGVHCWYRSEDISGNKVLSARLSTEAELAGNPGKKTQVMIETRGQGGYALVPGSPPQCHELGREYTYNPAGIPNLANVQRITPAERDLLWSLSRAFNRIPTPAPPAPPPPDREEGAPALPPVDLRPGNDFDARGFSWQEILERTGWQLCAGTWDLGKLTRPGKDPKLGPSATIGHCKGPNGEPLLNVFTTSDDFFPFGTYGKFRAFAILNASGDLAKAAGMLSRLGFGSPPKAKGKAAAGNGAAVPVDESKPWEAKVASVPSPSGISLAELMTLELPPPRYAIDGILCEGLTILGGKPKMGKSWLALLIAWAVAAAEDLDGRKVDGGAVLVLALEDTKRRIQSRINMLRPSVPWAFPERLTIHTDWQRANTGGLQHVAEWCEANKGSARLIVIDTLGKFRSKKKGGGNQYDEDYDDVGQLKKLCDAYGCSALIVHHTRKVKSEDPFDDLSGTLGISGAADGVLILERDRGTEGGQLYITGRDVEEVTVPLSLEKATHRWTLGKAADGIDTAARAVLSPASNKVDQCCKWILAFLSDYAYPASEMEAAAKLAGYSASAVRDAKAKLGNEGTRDICFNKNGSGPWWIGLVPKASWKLRPLDLDSLKKPKGSRASETSETSETSGRTGGPGPETLNSPGNSPKADDGWNPIENPFGLGT